MPLFCELLCSVKDKPPQLQKFKDRVRGEFIQPWGVADGQKLGIADLLHPADAASRTWRLA
jgi:hypothetical protein